jgi:hypothetical protein
MEADTIPAGDARRTADRPRHFVAPRASGVSARTIWPATAAAALLTFSVVVGLLIAAVLHSVSRNVSELLNLEPWVIDAARARARPASSGSRGPKSSWVH